MPTHHFARHRQYQRYSPQHYAFERDRHGYAAAPYSGGTGYSTPPPTVSFFNFLLWLYDEAVLLLLILTVGGLPVVLKLSCAVYYLYTTHFKNVRVLGGKH